MRKERDPRGQRKIEQENPELHKAKGKEVVISLGSSPRVGEDLSGKPSWDPCNLSPHEGNIEQTSRSRAVSLRAARTWVYRVFMQDGLVLLIH